MIEKHPPQEVHDERHLQSGQEAEKYLDNLRVSLEREGVAVTCHVHEGAMASVPAGIALHVKELAADIVMMCTHGDHDIRRFLWVPSRSRLLRRTPFRYSLSRPIEGYAVTAFTCRSIMLPLDGRKEHEGAVEVAQFLASAFNAAVFPVLAIPRSFEVGAGLRTISRLLPRVTEELLNMSTGQGKAYLEGIRERLEADGLTVSSLLVRGNPEKALLRSIARQKPNLVVLGTHGRSGLNAVSKGALPRKSVRAAGCRSSWCR